MYCNVHNKDEICDKYAVDFIPLIKVSKHENTEILII